MVAVVMKTMMIMKRLVRFMGNMVVALHKNDTNCQCTDDKGEYCDGREEEEEGEGDDGQDVENW